MSGHREADPPKTSFLVHDEGVVSVDSQVSAARTRGARHLGLPIAVAGFVAVWGIAVVQAWRARLRAPAFWDTYAASWADVAASPSFVAARDLDLRRSLLNALLVTVATVLVAICIWLAWSRKPDSRTALAIAGLALVVAMFAWSSAFAGGTSQAWNRACSGRSSGCRAGYAAGHGSIRDSSGSFETPRAGSSGRSVSAASAIEASSPGSRARLVWSQRGAPHLGGCDPTGS